MAQFPLSQSTTKDIKMTDRKSRGDKKYNNLRKEKTERQRKIDDGSLPKRYQDHRNHDSRNARMRIRLTGEMKKIRDDPNQQMEYIPPSHDGGTTYTWWDCKPCPPRVY